MEKFKVKEVDGKDYIYDIIRKKFVLITPEEWVRQQFLDFIINKKKYPSSLISVERQLKVGSMIKRFDILVYKNAEPWMLVECKSEDIVLNDKTLSQILSYNSTMKVKYLTITNGASYHCFNIEQHIWMDDLPVFQ